MKRLLFSSTLSLSVLFLLAIFLFGDFSLSEELRKAQLLILLLIVLGIVLTGFIFFIKWSVAIVVDTFQGIRKISYLIRPPMDDVHKKEGEENRDSSESSKRD